jgi:hypothetical protein
MLVKYKVQKGMHKAVQEIEERHMYQMVLIKKINIEKRLHWWR